jgi:hypothetical protein
MIDHHLLLLLLVGELAARREVAPLGLNFVIWGATLIAARPEPAFAYEDNRLSSIQRLFGVFVLCFTAAM